MVPLKRMREVGERKKKKETLQWRAEYVNVRGTESKFLLVYEWYTVKSSVCINNQQVQIDKTYNIHVREKNHLCGPYK